MIKRMTKMIVISMILVLETTTDAYATLPFLDIPRHSVNPVIPLRRGSGTGMSTLFSVASSKSVVPSIDDTIGSGILGSGILGSLYNNGMDDMGGGGGTYGGLIGYSSSSVYALDIGCGCGDSTDRLRKEMERDITYRNKNIVVVGIDKRRSSIQTARKRHPDISFVIRDATNTKFFPGMFKKIQIHLSLLEMEKLSDDLVMEMHRLLEPNQGELTIVDYMPDHPWMQDIRELPEPYRSKYYPQCMHHDPWNNIHIFRRQLEPKDLPVVSEEGYIYSTFRRFRSGSNDMEDDR
jgi:hypothetical protein